MNSDDVMTNIIVLTFYSWKVVSLQLCNTYLVGKFTLDGTFLVVP